MDDPIEMTTFDGEFVAETAAAYLVGIDDRKIWIPKSKARSVKISDGHAITFEIPNWLAEMKELV